MSPGFSRPFPRRGVESVGIGGIHDEIHNADTIVYVKDFFPAVSTVDGFEEASFFVERVEVTDRRNVHDIGVARVDQYLPDVVRVREPHVLPRFTGVNGLEHTGSRIGAAGHEHFTSGDPDDVRVRLRHSHVADRERRLLLEDRRPRRAVVYRLPEIPRSHSDIKRGGLTGGYGYALDPAPLLLRSDCPPFEIGEG